MQGIGGSVWLAALEQAPPDIVPHVASLKDATDRLRAGFSVRGWDGRSYEFQPGSAYAHIVEDHGDKDARARLLRLDWAIQTIHSPLIITRTWARVKGKMVPQINLFGKFRAYAGLRFEFMVVRIRVEEGRHVITYYTPLMRQVEKEILAVSREDLEFRPGFIEENR